MFNVIQFNLFKCFWLKLGLFIGKISKFLKLNLITLKLNYHYKYNIYLLLFIFICVISSIIVRSNIINLDLLWSNNNYISIIIHILLILSVIYALKLIFDIIKRCIQAYKIIPEFIKWYNNDVKDIKYIITLYYIQNIFFILLSCWILYIMFSKLNTFIDGIYLIIICLGIISSIIFIHYYPLKEFNLNTNMKDYSIWVYLILFLLILFYMLILPLLIINIINSDKFIVFKNNIIDDYSYFCKIEPNYMSDSSNSNSSINRRIFNNNNTIESSNNTVRLPDSNNLEVSGNNSVINRGNTVEIIPLNRNNNNYIGTINVTNISSRDNNLPIPVRDRLESNILPPYSNTNSSNNQIPPIINTTTNNDINPNTIMSLIKKDIDYNNNELSSSKSGIVESESNKAIIRRKKSLINITKDKYNKIGSSTTSFFKNKKILPVDNIDNKSILSENQLLLENKSVIKLNNNKGDGFKMLRQFKSDGNIGKLFNLNKKIVIKSINYPINNNNIFIIPNNLYDSLIISTNKLLLSLHNNPYTNSFITAYDYLNNIIKYATLNKEVQSNLIDIIHNHEYEVKYFRLLIDKYLIEYEMSNLEDKNIKFNTLLHYHLRDNFINKIDVETLKYFNANSLREFYVLNDFNYLNSKSKYNINLTLLNNLFASRMEIENMINIMKLEPSLINNNEFEILERDYKLFYNNYETVYHQFNKHTMDLYNDRYYNDSKYISVNNIKKSREIHYFQYLFNQFN